MEKRRHSAEGTARVLDLYPGSEGSHPSHIAVIGDTLYFRAADGTMSGTEQTPSLWRSDGTASGTIKLMDGWAESMANVGGTLLFAGHVFDPTSPTGIAKVGLWTSDGTPEGTVFVKNLSTVPGQFGDVHGPIIDLHGTAVFAGNGSSFDGSPWIECEFAALRYFALNGTDHQSHAEQDAAIGAHIRWRNHRAQPKTNFAPNSRIREPGYTIKAAR